MKAINCDMCGEPIKMKVGELFILEIQKITGNFKAYPNEYSSNYIHNKDCCKKCLVRIEFLIGLKKIKPKKKIVATHLRKAKTTKKK